MRSRPLDTSSTTYLSGPPIERAGGVSVGSFSVAVVRYPQRVFCAGCAKTVLPELSVVFASDSVDLFLFLELSVCLLFGVGARLRRSRPKSGDMLSRISATPSHPEKRWAFARVPMRLQRFLPDFVFLAVGWKSTARRKLIRHRADFSFNPWRFESCMRLGARAMPHFSNTIFRMPAFSGPALPRSRHRLRSA